jgi:hypothetical protein
MAQSEQRVKVHIRIKGNKPVNGWIELHEIPVLLNVYTDERDSIAVPTKFIRKIILEPDVCDNKNGSAYFNNTFVGLLSGRSSTQSEYRTNITAEMVQGIRLNTYLWPGLGFGYDRYPEVNTLSFFMSLRGDLLKRQFTPFYFLDLGSGPAWGETDPDFQFQDAKGGLMYHIGGGLKIYSDSRINILLAGGFKSRKVTFIRRFGGDAREDILRTYQNFSFRIGVGF